MPIPLIPSPIFSEPSLRLSLPTMKPFNKIWIELISSSVETWAMKPTTKTEHCWSKLSLIFRSIMSNSSTMPRRKTLKERQISNSKTMDNWDISSFSKSLLLLTAITTQIVKLILISSKTWLRRSMMPVIPSRLRIPNWLMLLEKGKLKERAIFPRRRLWILDRLKLWLIPKQENLSKSPDPNAAQSFEEGEIVMGGKVESIM